MFLVIGARSSAGVSSRSDACRSGVSPTSEVVLRSALVERVSSVCAVFSSAPSFFARVLDCVALSGGLGGSGGSLGVLFGSWSPALDRLFVVFLFPVI
jgi:hypothetical protein